MKNYNKLATILIVLFCAAAVFSAYASADIDTVTDPEGIKRADALVIVKDAYRDVLLRKPDTGGLEHYVNCLLNDSRDQVGVRCSMQSAMCDFIRINPCIRAY
jgi:hypothetical protein